MKKYSEYIFPLVEDIKVYKLLSNIYNLYDMNTVIHQILVAIKKREGQTKSLLFFLF